MRCNFFLAAAHRGSDFASFLHKLLRTSMPMSPMAYVEDLGPDLPCLQIINYEFRHYADQLSLWSLYETLKTNLGFMSSLMVDRNSATLGGRLCYCLFLCSFELLNVDHRGVCKYDSPLDRNFVTLRNSLVATVDDVVGECAEISTILPTAICFEDRELLTSGAILKTRPFRLIGSRQSQRQGNQY